MEWPKSAPADGEADRQAARRRAYVVVRLPEVQEAIKRLADERVALNAALQAPESASESGPGKTSNGTSGDSARKLRERRAYVATRLEILRAERKELAEERRLSHVDGEPAES